MRETALRVSGLQKHYGRTIALDGAGLEVTAGEVHALLGENGAGKSTLIKVLSGLVQPDGGTIEIFGQPAQFRTPRDSHRLGVRTAFQEISLVKDLTVAQNFLLMEEPTTSFGTIRRTALEAFVRDQLARLGIHSIDPRAEVGKLDLPSRQKIEIARAISRDPRILLLDEPTASLSAHDVIWLGEVIERLRASGVTVLFISHRIQEIREFCAGLTIFRNGKTVGAYRTNELGNGEIVELMVGRSLGTAFPPRRSRPEGQCGGRRMLAARGLTTADGISDVSFDLAAGQILGLGGLDGMGQRQLFLALFGVIETVSGEIVLDGQPVRIRSPADAISKGIGMLPEDRKSEGLFLELDARENVSLPSIGRFLLGGLVRSRHEEAAVSAALDLVDVPQRALWTPARDFSGGNQQKIALAKWLLTKSRILLLYDPTRGIDIGTKAEIYRLIRRYADAGGAVLFYSTDIPELVHLCDDVMVIYRGRIVDQLSDRAISESAIMHAALGQSAADARQRDSSADP